MIAIVLHVLLSSIPTDDLDRLERSIEQLHEAARALPDIDHPALVDPFVDAAEAEGTEQAPAALLVALGWPESRFDPRARPACGAMQVYPQDIGERDPSAACARWARDVQAGVRAGVVELEMMLADHRVRGDLRWALLYRACGNAAFDGSCSAAKYAWVTAALARYRQLAGPDVVIPTMR